VLLVAEGAEAGHNVVKMRHNLLKISMLAPSFTAHISTKIEN